MNNAMDRLIQKIKEKNNPTVMGLDPRYDMIPSHIRSKYSSDLHGAADSIAAFNKALIDATYDIIPAVKPQIAFYEMYGIEGLKAFQETCNYAKQKGMIVIADCKRGDIGSTAEGYSSAFLGRTAVGAEEFPVFDCDFVTVNPYLGIDGVAPFIEDCKKHGKGIFVLVKTSNPSSGELQDLKLESGEEIYLQIGKLVENWGEGLVGKYGYSSVGAVVGATYPKQLEELREKMPKTCFLIPGYGAQRRKSRRYQTRV